MYYYLPLFFTFLNLLITLVLFYYAFYLFKKEQSLSEKSKNAVLEYEKIIESATKKAQNILEHAEIISKEVKNSYEGVFNTISNDVKKTTEDFLRRVLIDQEILLSGFTKNVNEKYTNLFEKTLESADKKYLQKQKDLDEEMLKKVQKATIDVEKYKKKRINEVDKSIKEFLDQIIKKTLPKHVRVEDQEQIVLEVINKAHEDGFFNRL